MKKIGKYLIAAGAMLSTGMAARAQTAEDMLRLSQYNYSFGTARSAALGGAFTSLGADLSSMTLNPAGLGMYRSSEFGFSPSITTSSMNTVYKSEAHPNGFSRDASKTRFSVGNLGVALNIFNGAGAMTSVTVGFGYNKLADFNTSLYAQSYDHTASILDFFQHRANGHKPGALGESTEANPYIAFNNFPIDMWGTLLAYQTYMVDPISASPNEMQYTTVLSGNTLVDPSLRLYSRGSVGEYTFSGGFNIRNRLYFGLALGIQDIYYNVRSIYNERTHGDATEMLRSMEYMRSLKMVGTGVNFKFGITVRPIDNLRIGVAIHTPTYVSMDEEYREEMASDFYNPIPPRKSVRYDSPFARGSYKVTTPTRFLAGISYTWPGVGLVTFDYERVWYNAMKLNMNYSNWDYERQVNGDVRNWYRPVNNFRGGIEATPLPNFYVRAGYAWYDNVQKLESAYQSYANIKSYQNYTGGLGYRFPGNFSIDVAYIYTDYKYVPFDLYYMETPQGTIDSGVIHPKMNRHTVTLSMAYRF